MTQVFQCLVLPPNPRIPQSHSSARHRLAAIILATLALTPLAAAFAQEDLPRKDCLQDKKLEIADPGTKKIDYRDRTIRTAKVLTGEQTQIIDSVVKYYVYRLSWPELRKGAINQIRADLLADANAPQNSRAFRREVSKRLVQYLPDLFDNHCVIRMLAARILAELDDEEAFENGVARLAAELPKPEQDEGLKYVACQAVARLANRGFRLLRNRDDTINAVVALLNDRKQLNPWTQYQAIMAVRALGAPAERIRAMGDRELLPALQVLLEAVHDPSAEPRVRARAAEAIGAVDVTGLQAKLNYHLVAYEVADLAAQSARQYVAHFDEIQLTEQLPSWKYYFGLTVLSFRGDHRETGLSRRAASDPEQLKLVKEAEDRVVALTKAVLDPLADASDIEQPLGDLQAWLDQNPPTDRRLAAVLPPLPESAAQPSP
jgi:hypothetical protein